jgi:hypothetical protein
MSNTIQIKRSTTAAAVPTAGQLAVGELAVNLVDKKLFTKDALGAVVSLTPDAPVIPVISDKIQPVTASVASNALTVTLNPTTLDFRSATLGSGTVNTRTVATAISAVVPSGATLGTTNAVLSKVTLLAIDNAGTIELAVCNGSLSLDESTLISTTALSADADSATVVYSTTARTNVPFRIVGFVESTQSTAGTWASAPSKIQGYGGLALSPDIKSALNATGSAPVYACRAWVNFNGTGTVAIRASGNVSSITDNAAGNYTVNFTTAMPDADYAVAGMCAQVSSGNPQMLIMPSAGTQTTTAYQVMTGSGAQSTLTLYDSGRVFVAFFR